MGSCDQRRLVQPSPWVHERIRVPPNASFQFTPTGRRVGSEHVGADRFGHRRCAETPDRRVDQGRARRLGQ